MNSKRNQSATAPDFDKDFRGDLRSEVIEYLRAHPEAVDTIDGILDWWLPMQRYENAKKEIQQVLLDLVQQGLIEEIVLGNGKQLYRMLSGKEKQF